MFGPSVAFGLPIVSQVEISAICLNYLDRKMCISDDVQFPMYLANEAHDVNSQKLNLMYFQFKMGHAHTLESTLTDSSRCDVEVAQVGMSE